jgi:hypothetical protein
VRLGGLQSDNFHLHRIRQRNALGPSIDGQNYAVVHATGYIKNWPPSNEADDPSGNSHHCLVAIGRLQVNSTPNTNDLVGSVATNGEKLTTQFPGEIFKY